MTWKIPSRTALLIAGTLLLGACSGGSLNPGPDSSGENIGDTFALTTDGRLVTFSRAGGAVISSKALTGATAGDTLLAIATRPAGTPAGQLYVLGSSGRLYTADLATGALTLKSTLAADPADATSPYVGLSGATFAIDFNPVPDRPRVVSNTGQNLRINVDTGLVTTDTDLTAGGTPASGITAVSYTNNFADACRTALFYVDTTLDRLLTATDPNAGVLTAVGNLGVNASEASGFEVSTEITGTNTAIAVLTVGGTPTVYTINLTTGAATANGALTGLGTAGIRAVTSFAQAGTPTQALGELAALTSAGTLVSVQSGAPQKACTTAVITGLAAGERLLGIDLRPADGLLYGLGSTGRVYTVNATTGAATLKATLAADAADTTAPFTTLDGADFAVDVNPVPDRLRVISNTGQNLRINMDTGATTTDTPINPPGAAISAAAYTNSIAGTGTATIFTLDPTLDRLAVQGQPSGNPNNGDQQAVGGLGIDASSIGGFDINGRTGVALAAMSVGAATTSGLYSVNLTTGAATLVNTIAGNARVVGLTFTTAAAATLFGVTDTNQLVSFRTTAPGTLLSSVPITGLQGGETIIGFDRRPANGTFYALTDAGRLYTVSTAGVATLGQTLVADVADATSPYTGLVGTLYGVDFNPVPDRLRVISSGEQNLRINVDTGATTTDGTLARAAFAVSAAAYTNNFAGTTATTLYVIDTLNDRLMTQSPPNAGTLNEIGALGVDAGAVNAFEIVGPDTAVAVLSTATGNGLYTINLATGAATLVGAVAAAGNPGDGVSGLTAVPSATTPAADSALLAVVNGTTLASFARNAPGTTLASVAVSGLHGGETLVGIDYRPANGTLYGLGSTGRLYTIDAATGAATQVGAAFALSGTNFGVDVNPLADRLRIVSDSGANLRVNMDTGAVVAVDTDLNLPAPDAFAAAYARNVAGTTTTTLYVLDLASNTLQIQSPPNNGTLVTVGRLDPTATFIAGTFDIASADDGFALAALTPTGAAQSTLYRVNLRTGALTAIGTIGPTGTPILRAFTIDLR